MVGHPADIRSIDLSRHLRTETRIFRGAKKHDDPGGQVSALCGSRPGNRAKFFAMIYGEWEEFM